MHTDGTDETEERAKVILENLLDLHFVKPYIRNRDKVLNVDGEIELVNEDRKPIGKFDVQVKSIGQDETKFNCPTSLVSYSMNSTTLPVLLICVDIQNKCAYWRQVSSEMSEFKENQKSFTIFFSKESDSIDETGGYIQRWNNIARDYQERIAKFPPVSKEVANKLNLQGIEPADLILFQKYIDTINQLLDFDFISIKKMLFPNMWKLGVGIVSSDQKYLSYQIFISPWGEPKPLVCKLDKGGLPTTKWDPNTLSQIMTSRESLIDPIKSGTEFVLEKVRNIVEHKSLPIFGKMIASDVLIAFIDKFSNCLGMTPGLDKYSVEDLDYALNHHLMQMCVSVFGQFIKNSSDMLNIDLDWLSSYLSKIKIVPANSDGSAFRFLISSKSFPIKIVFDSLRYLTAEQVTDIKRPFGKRDLSLSSDKKPIWIWSFHSDQNQIDSVTRILNKFIEEYSEFIQRNQLHFPKSPYLNPDIAIVFHYEPGKLNGTISEGPALEEYHIINPEHSLPKVSVVSKGLSSFFIKDENSLKIKIDGIEYKIDMASYSDAADFFQRAPVLDLIYKMLCKDLSKHYNIFIHPRIL